MINKMITLMIIGLAAMPAVLGGTMKIYPSDDAYVNQLKLNNNYNTNFLLVGTSPDYPGYGKYRAFLKFNLPNIDGEITSAKLSLDPTPINSPNIQLYYVSNDLWNENTINAGNQPSFSTLIDSKVLSSPERFELNVLPAINEQDNILSLMLKSEQESTNNVYASFYSSEDSEGNTWWPYLEINYSDSGSCPSLDYSNVCCALDDIQMMGFINKFNRFDTSYSDIQMMGFINKFNRFEALC
jgi:hypothetical protein